MLKHAWWKVLRFPGVRFGAALPLLMLSACGTIVDPAPYSPVEDKRVVILPAPDAAPIYKQEDILVFANLPDATKKLQSLSFGYRDMAIRLSRQQLLLDVPMFGLAIATVANGAFGGSKAATIALGLSSAAVGGAKAYYAPQTKVAAYVNAQHSLMCASQVADRMAQINATKLTAIINSRANLMLYIPIASDALANSSYLPVKGGKETTLTKDQMSSLLAARDTATKALSDISVAADVLDNAHIDLAVFASATIDSTDKSIYTGTQNLDNAIGLIQKSGTSTSTATTGTTAKLHAADLNDPNVPKDFGALVADLTTEAANAESLTTAINTAWATKLTCALPS